MNTQSNQDRIDDLFDQAKELPPEEREAFLSSASNSDADILLEVQKMLAAHNKLEQSPEFLASAPNSPIRDGNAANLGHDPLIGQHIGPYEVKSRLGEGGFGEVYLATRTKDYRQEVAIKILLDDVKNLPRFERERQLLADLQHENIARLLDGGTLPNGRPYIIMEYVDGQLITQYCDDNRLPVKARLALFKQVCKAVAFAHRYGAIHRDIKPLNILVNKQGIVKLLDFGIAKLLDSPSRQPSGPALQTTAMTDLGPDAETVSFAFDSSSVGVAGTALGAIGPMSPAYASPEQAHGKEVSTASDIYSLGVVLYELLTGCRPYYFQRMTLEEIQRVICDVQPPKPSSVVLDHSLLSVDSTNTVIPPTELAAEVRNTTTKALHKTLRGDLDAVVLRSLTKDQTERYQTVEKLNEELDRFEQGFEVDALPISRRGRIVRLIKRNKTVTGLAALTTIAMIGGSLASTLFGLHASRQAAAAIEREKETTAVLSFVENKMFNAGRQPGKDYSPRPDLTVREAVAAALPLVNTSFPQQPLIEAKLRKTFGRLHFFLEDFKTAAQQFHIAHKLFDREFGPKDIETLSSLRGLADCYHVLGRIPQAVNMNKEILAVSAKQFGRDHELSLSAMNGLANCYSFLKRPTDAIKLREDIVAIRRNKFGPEDPTTLVHMQMLAQCYSLAGRSSDAITLGQEVLKIVKSGGEFDTIMLSLDRLEALHDDQNSEVVAINQEALAIANATLGERHSYTVHRIRKLAGAYEGVGRYVEALNLYEQVLKIRQETSGPRHPDTIEIMNDVARFLATSPTKELRDGNRAKSLATKACELNGYRNSLFVSTLGAACAETGDFNSAVKWAEKSLELLGNDQGTMLRDQFSREIANYKAKKPTRRTAAKNDGELSQERDAK